MINKYSVFEIVRKFLIYVYSIPLGLNRDEKNKIWRRLYSKGLEKYISFNNGISEKASTSYIFTGWFQGYDGAPEIVQRCMDSIKANCGSATYVNITRKNYRKYAQIPDYIINKWESGIISDAHFSDILRTCLLYEHGGVWLDATVMLFGPLPEFIQDSNVFFFQESFLDNSDVGVSSWCIRSKYRSNSFIGTLRDSLFSYWRKNNKLQDYYLYHDFVALLANSNRYHDMWEKMPYVSNVPPHVLQKELLKPYKKKQFEEIIRLSSIQKLTYKLGYNHEHYKSNLGYLLNKKG